MELSDNKSVSKSIIRKFFKSGLLYFTIPFFVFVIVGVVLILVLKKGDIVLAINSQSSEGLDRAFLFITKIGLGSTIAIAGIIFLFYKFRWSLLVFINLAWVGIFTNIFKRLFFGMSPRPLNYFYYDDFSRFLYDAPLSYYYTFPSGHSITIYAFCSLMAFLLNRKTAGIILFFIALFVGISRIYLLQHFFIDTYFGALFGITSTFLTLWIDEKFGLAQKKLLNHNLFHLFFQK